MKVQSLAKAPSSGKVITMNLRADQCLVFDFVTKEDLASIIEQYDIDRFQEFWGKKLLRVVNDNGAICLEAFKSRRNPSCNMSLLYFKTPYIQKISKIKKKGQELTTRLQALPLEEQRRIVSEGLPKTHEEAKNALRKKVEFFGVNFLELLSRQPSPDTFIHELTSDLHQGNFTNNTFELLIKFWANGYILFPQNFPDWPFRNKWQKLYDASLERQESLRQIYTTSCKTGYIDRPLAHIINYFAITSTTAKADLSIELIKEYYDLSKHILNKKYSEHKYDSALSLLHKANLCLTISYNTENPEITVEAATRRESIKTLPPRDIKFGWISISHPKLEPWIEYLHLHLSSSKSARVGNKIASMNSFVDYLGTLENPPRVPWEVVRHIHITDPTLINKNTFYEYLLAQDSTDGKRLKNTLTTVRRFFSWLRDFLVANGKSELSNFNDPIFDKDQLGQVKPCNRTTRDSLPPFLITEMKSALIENDFEVPKSFNRSNTIQTIDQDTGYSVRVFYPGLAICMYTLLDSPIRSHQARWLDSGSLDEKIYNHLTRTTEYNPSPYAIMSRQQGVLQLSKDALRSENWLSMWINTNKTGSFDPDFGGYHIPYVSPKLEELIKIQIDWSKKYLPPLKSPLKYRDYMQGAREYRPDVVKGPEISPLFRDPTVADQKSPIRYTKLARFYTMLLEVVQDRIFEKHGHRLKLVTTDENGKRIWAVDLHSLRVSGITNLIEAGVPIEVVQQYVAGHKVLIMTLHYLKYSPAKLRRFIEDAHLRMQNDQDFVGSQSFIDAINEFIPFLLSQSGAGTGPGFEAFSMGDGIFIVNSDGICPGTSCSTGMVIKEGQNPVYGPVPGKRCGLCRYWITGPAHLLGQITAVNNLAYSIRKKGLELARLNELKLDAEDADNKRLARELRDRIDLLNREIELDVAEWASRYRFAEQSIIQMDEYLQAKDKIIATDATPQVPMMTCSAPLELKVTLEHAHEFALLDQITQMAAFNPGFTNLQAELEKHQVLSKMMMANGMKPFLLTLSDEHAREAGNLLSALVLQQVDTQDLDSVLSGKKPLEEYPYLASTLFALEEAALSGQEFLPNALSRLSELLVPTDSVHRANDDREDLFG